MPEWGPSLRNGGSRPGRWMSRKTPLQVSQCFPSFVQKPKTSQAKATTIIIHYTTWVRWDYQDQNILPILLTRIRNSLKFATDSIIHSDRREREPTTSTNLHKFRRYVRPVNDIPLKFNEIDHHDVYRFTLMIFHCSNKQERGINGQSLRYANVSGVIIR